MTLKGVTERIRLFFFSYPHSSAKQCCEMLGLDHKKYGQMCRNIKSQTKKLLQGDIQGRVLSPLVHREEWRVESLGRATLDAVRFEACRRQPSRDQPKPFDEWYVVPNRNRMMLLRNDYVTIRVFPKSGTCRVLPAKPMPYEWVKIAVQNAFFKAGVDLKLCEEISETIEPKARHRIFKVGAVTPFKIAHYKKSLGLTIKADGSHPNFIETEEDYPAWIKPLLTSFARNTEALDALRTDFPQQLGRIASSFEESMREHLEIIKVFREESIMRSEAVMKMVKPRKAERKPRRQKKSRAHKADETIHEIRKKVEETLAKLQDSEARS